MTSAQLPPDLAWAVESDGQITVRDFAERVFLENAVIDATPALQRISIDVVRVAASNGTAYYAIENETNVGAIYHLEKLDDPGQPLRLLIIGSQKYDLGRVQARFETLPRDTEVTVEAGDGLGDAVARLAEQHGMPVTPLVKEHGNPAPPAMLHLMEHPPDALWIVANDYLKHLGLRRMAQLAKEDHVPTFFIWEGKHHRKGYSG